MHLGQPAQELIASARALVNDTAAWSQIDTTPYYDSGNFITLYDAAALSGDSALRDAVCRLIERMLAVDSWVVPVHYPMTYDHCTANVASQISFALDRIGQNLPPGQLSDFRKRLREKFLPKFVNTWENELDPWSKRDYVENWKIMTCGETGIAVLYCWDGSDLCKRALRGCVEGVLQVLATVPVTGEYQEGFGYWLHTMAYGLKFAIALRQASNGQIDLFAHPRLNVTADFLLSLVRPDTSVYSWGDNHSTLPAAEMTMLGAQLKRGDILFMTRQLPMKDFNHFFYEDLSIPSQTPALKDAIYLHDNLGVCTMRTGWGANAAFAAFKCGKAKIGHGHLDQNSFVISRDAASLAIDQGIWPYAHFLGSFGLWSRWNFDNMSSFGHNGILVDGQSQTLTDDAGKIETHYFSDTLSYVVGQAADCYGGKLTNYRRWFIWVKPDFFLVVDRLESDSLRRYEWIFQHGGELENAAPDSTRYGASQEQDKTAAQLSPVPRSVICKNNQCLTIDMIYPSSAYGARVADVRLQSFYTASDRNNPVEPYVQYRSYSPLHTAKHMMFVVGMYLGKPEQITMNLISDKGPAPKLGNADDLEFLWPQESIPAPIVEFTIAGQAPRRIVLDEENLSVRIE